MKARTIAALIFAATALQPARADSNTSCGPETQWEDFSSISMAIKTSLKDDPGDFAVEQTVYGDGTRLVATGAGQHSEIILLKQGDSALTLASEPRTPIELGEIGIVYAAPLQALKQQFHALCDLREHVEYPVDIRLEGYALAGELDRTGDSVHFVLVQDIRGRKGSVVGHVGYRAPRGAIPGELSIEGWTIFAIGSVRPDSGTPSTFKTLRELQDCLKPKTTP